LIDRVISSGAHHRRLIYLSVVLLLSAIGFFYYVNYLESNGYLPSPFLYDKSDTFMDLFNVLYWAYEEGRYTDWGSVYPPFNFLVLRFINFVFAGGGYGDPALMRENSQYVIIGVCLAYLAIPAILLKTRCWRDFSKVEKILVYFTIVLSTPMLFTLERGNLILVAPILLALALSKIGMARSASIALLINIKPYFVLLMIYYIARRNWRGFFTCVILSGSIFVMSGLMLDPHFLVFLTNIFSFSQEDVFSLREVLAMPSSISAFTYVLNNPDGALFASEHLNEEHIATIVYLIEGTKWSVITVSMAALFLKARLMRDVEILALLVVVISNLGIWVGGYTFILYIALIPAFLKMRASWIYMGLLALLAMPLDVISLSDQIVGLQYSYLADTNVHVHWTLGLGSAIRPIANILLVLVLVYEFFTRKKDRKNIARNTVPVMSTPAAVMKMENHV
jgi:hypothetical protein